ncbi:MerR family transcriptional regulator [filamentous cyanobacterium LEGE 11480]|uniref:MerR family transcriptional regulator n=1 Tax=Romeriopsis navalis LEGE 11480 TaxID=2777977 RepID=A0A928VIE2_9CYAN|nr:MerR family transcriptional regulator [Romeriopsis navalis]MBE9029166.1 MerR family transcriptional regulator [Romeriopsis navalis LEGE 11480]
MFRIGAFSKITQVPASQLRYYDEIGLFKPIDSDSETGYRYYSVQQLAQLNRILALKDLGFSLEQVKHLLEDAISPAEIRGMLVLKKAQIEQNLQAEAARLRVVESRLKQLEHQGIGQDDVVLKSLPAQPFLSLRQTFRDLNSTLSAVNTIGQSVAQQVPQAALGRFAAVIYGELYENQDWDLEFGFLLNQSLDLTVPLPNDTMMTVRELPPVPTAVTAMRFGGPENGHLSYSAIGTWAETNQYQLIGPGREVFIVPPQPGHESEMVVEIQFPVAAITG